MIMYFYVQGCFEHASKHISEIQETGFFAKKAPLLQFIIHYNNFYNV